MASPHLQSSNGCKDIFKVSTLHTCKDGKDVRLWQSQHPCTYICSIGKFDFSSRVHVFDDMIKTDHKLINFALDLNIPKPYKATLSTTTKKSIGTDLTGLLITPLGILLLLKTTSMTRYLVGVIFCRPPFLTMCQHRYLKGEWIGNAIQYYTRSSVQLFLINRKQPLHNSLW